MTHTVTSKNNYLSSRITQYTQNFQRMYLTVQYDSHTKK